MIKKVIQKATEGLFIGSFLLLCILICFGSSVVLERKVVLSNFFVSALTGISFMLFEKRSWSMSLRLFIHYSSILLLQGLNLLLTDQTNILIKTPFSFWLFWTIIYCAIASIIWLWSKLKV